MDFNKLLWDWIPNAQWDLIKQIAKWLAGAGIVAVLTGVAQRIRSGALDWWILGTVFAVSVGVLYLTTTTTESSSRSRRIEPSGAHLSPLGAQVVSLSGPSELTVLQAQRLKLVFLSLPRPCFVKITAAPEHMGLRNDFLMVLRESYLNSSQERHATIIGKCEMSEDERDKHPELYAKELNDLPQGMIVINGADVETVRVIVEDLRALTNFKVRPGTTKPDAIVENWLYIQLGTGSLAK